MEVKKNRNEVFRYICKHETVSNPDIAYNMRISLQTATQITKELIAEGLLEEKGELQSTGGRGAKALSAVVNAGLAVGLDITKNHIALVLTNIAGEILKYERIHQPYGSEKSYIDLDKGQITYSHILGVENVSFDSVSAFFLICVWFQTVILF